MMSLDSSIIYFSVLAVTGIIGAVIVYIIDKKSNDSVNPGIDNHSRNHPISG